MPRPMSPAPSTASSSNVLPPHLPPHLRPSVLVTRKDQAASLAAYEILLGASKSYTQALLALSGASTHFAHALQECARLKGAHQVGSQLHAASGLEYLVASHAKLLADGFWKDFSIPLLEAFDEHRRATAERELNHAKVMAEKSRHLKECEEQNLRGGGAKGRGKRGLDRDLGSFRRALEELQRLVDGLDEERAGHYVEVLAAEEEEWDRVSSKLSHILRLQVEVHDRLSSKPLSDPILEPMLSAIPDPFNAYAPNGNAHASSSSSSVHQGDGAGEIFSVLQHSGTLGGGGSSSHPAAGVSSVAAMDHFNHDGWGSGSETLTPAGLLSPRTPSTGLPRAGSSAWGSPSNKRILPGQAAVAAAMTPARREEEAFAAAPAVLGSGSAAPPSTNAGATTTTTSSGSSSAGGGGTGPSGEFSFAALGLTSATHPQTSGVGGGTSSIGSPLFGSEDGSDGQGRVDSDDDDDDLQPLVVRRNADEAEDVLADEEEEGEEEEEGGGSGLTAGVSSSRPSLPSTNSTSTVTGAKPVSSTPAAPAHPPSSSSSGAKPRLGTSGSARGVAGLGYRLKKALSIIDDEAITDEEKRKSLHETVGGGGGIEGGVSVDTVGEVTVQPSEGGGEAESEEGDTSGSKHSHGK